MSLLTRPQPEFSGYLSPAKLNKVVSAVDEDDDCDEEREGSGVESDTNRVHVSDDPEGVTSSAIAQEGPFSALAPSMRPNPAYRRRKRQSRHRLKKDSKEDSKIELESYEDTDDDTSVFDEFGFLVEVEDGPEHCTSSLLTRPFQATDSDEVRLKWIAHLEFAGTKRATNGETSTPATAEKTLLWDNVADTITRTEKLRTMVLEGIPHSLRPHIWLSLSGANAKRADSDVSYKQIVRASSNDHLMTSRQIEKDLLRTLPHNACFSTLKSVGVPRLRRILRGIAWLYPDIGYCHGMHMIVATFLLIMEEEDSFWMMASVVEELLPASYFSPSLVGIQADQLVLRGLIATTLPAVDSLLTEHDIELSLITLNWFLTLYASVVHIRILMRLWDLLLFEGSRVLFQIALGILKMNESALLAADNSAEIFNILSTLPGKLDDVDALLEAMGDVGGAVTDVIIEDNRRRQVALVLINQGSWRGGLNRHLRGPIRLTRRTMKRSKSVMDLLLFTKDDSADKAEQEKSKNIRQTEVMLSLRDAIVRIAHYFQAADPSSYADAIITADYSLESHTRDHDAFLSVLRARRKRARAVVDFERRDDDELGFRRHDIITIISQRDEHCWVGELNGQRGWFPAKLVEVLDERSKQYSFAGDDSVSATVTDLVRGVLCPAIKQVLEHGLRRSPLLLGPCHPWLFVEEAVRTEVERDFRSVYSRLVLCKTFRLNEDGKVLSPEELLFRCVEAVNFSHNPAHAQMDVKLRSLICLGLNEQALHLWLEALASNEAVVAKWYHPWAFMSSPGWVQIKCELRLLAQFSFKLSPEWELLPGGKQKPEDEQKPLQEGVKDMLVKHHLFSWDL